jgi:trigger factor
LAQLVEQRTLNPWVAGSSPAGPTIFYEYRESARVAELEDALDLGSSGETHAGSSPALRTIFILGKEFDMSYEIKEKTNTKVVFQATNTKEEIESAKKNAYRKLANKVNVPGFRKGKAPYEIGARFVGESRLLEEALDELMNKDLNEFLEKEKIDPITRPDVKLEKIDENEVVLTFTVEFLPEVEVEIPEKVEIPIDNNAIDKEVENKLKDVQNTFTEVKEVKRAVKNGDLVDVQYKINEVKNADWKDVTLEVGKKQFVGDFDEQIIGKKAGDSFEVKSDNMTVQVKVVAVKEKNVPPIDDELAKDAGFDTLEDMKSSIKEEALKNSKLQLEESKGNKVLEIIAEKLNVELPEKLVKEETETEMTRISRLIPEVFGQPKAFVESYEEVDEFKKWADSNKETYNIALKLEGLVKNKGIHVSAIALSHDA